MSQRMFHSVLSGQQLNPHKKKEFNFEVTAKKKLQKKAAHYADCKLAEGGKGGLKISITAWESLGSTIALCNG